MELMERARVVHYAKTRTSKVLAPANLRHPSSPDGDTRHAPLALGEADVPSSRLSGDNLHHRSPSGISVPVKQQGWVGNPESLTQLGRGGRQTVFLGRQDGLYHSPSSRVELPEEGRLRKAPSGRKIYPGPVVTAPSSRTYPSGNGQANHAPATPRQSALFGTEQDRSVIKPGLVRNGHMTTSIVTNSGGYVRQTVIANITSPHDVTDDRRTSPMNSSNPQFLHDKSSSTNQLDLDENTVQKFDQGKPTKLIQTNSLHIGSSANDVNRKLKSQQPNVNDQGQASNDDVVIHWAVNEHNAIICRKLSIRSNSSFSDNGEDTKRYSKPSIESPHSPNDVDGSSSDCGVASPDELFNSDKDSGVQSDSTSHNSDSQASECDERLDLFLTPPTGLTPPTTLSMWKRNSLRMATQGFTSMSDLTNSLECLQLISQDAHRVKVNPTCSSSQQSSDQYLDSLLQSGSLTPTNGDVLYSSNGHIYTFFERLNGKDTKSPGHELNSPDKDTNFVHSSMNVPDDEHNVVMGFIKRNSYAMATRSNSDLSCDHFEVDTSSVSKRGNRSTNVDSSRKGPSVGRGSHQLSPRLVREESISSSPLDSSFGSFYSCQSSHFVSAKNSPFLDRCGQVKSPSQNRRSQVKSPLLDRSHQCLASTLRANHSRQSSGQGNSSDDEMEDSSMYYTASDTSYVETQSNAGSQCKAQPVSPLVSQRNLASQTAGRSGKIPVSAQTRGLSPRSLKKLNTVLQCYGCGGDRSQSVTMVNKPYNRTQDVDRKRTATMSSISQVMSTHRFADSKMAANSRLPVNRHSYKSTPAAVPFNNFDLTLHRDQYYFEDSLSSPDSESDWPDMPRSPPSLGRPKRKVYAGFDSQPLPIDSFMSDSSSCYTDCGSWSSRATSKSAEVERSFHGSMENMTSNTRSMSAEAVDTITPTRQMSQNTLLDFFRLGGKQTTVCENNHNVYVSPDQYGSGDKLAGSYEALTFSNESLHSNLSTDTTTNYSNTRSSNRDLTKAPEITKNNAKRYNGPDYHNCERRNNELGQDVHRKQSFELNLRNSQEFLSNSWTNDSSAQQKPIKAASSASMSRPRYPPKRKYFPSKEIIDLLVNSDRRTPGQGLPQSSSVLEKQAQKVCRVILCCNDMESSMHSGQYQF